MYDYVTTKPELNEETLSGFGITMEHGYLKDAAAKVHKYIKRWKNKAGKWVYQYKNKAENQIINVRRYLKVSDPKTITYNGEWHNIIDITKKRNWKGKPNSIVDGEEGSRLNAGIDAGRKRAGIKRYKGYKSKQARPGSRKKYIGKGSGTIKRRKSIGNELPYYKKSSSYYYKKAKSSNNDEDFYNNLLAMNEAYNREKDILNAKKGLSNRKKKNKK